MKLFSTVFILIFLVSCASGRKDRNQSDVSTNRKIENLEEVLNRAEENATPAGRNVLQTGRSMIEKKKIVRGSCWDYVNAVYNKSGVKADQRVTPLKSKMGGPYADSADIQAGDWLYFINYSFRESDHSGIFVEWVDYENKLGVILSYIGGKKRKPGNYKVYDLRHVYYIIRSK